MRGASVRWNWGMVTAMLLLATGATLVLVDDGAGDSFRERAGWVLVIAAMVVYGAARVVMIVRERRR